MNNALVLFTVSPRLYTDFQIEPAANFKGSIRVCNLDFQLCNLEAGDGA
jgi:hypothetical protein